jgi:RNA-directed DNA polymerase
MRTLYIEGVATHDGPESCAVAREGGGEALAGVRVGQDIEPRKNLSSGCRRFQIGGRQHWRRRYRELPSGPARSENQGMRGVSMRENREVPCSPVRGDHHEAGRSGKAEAVRLR